MAGSMRRLAPLPQAPTAALPAGLSPDGASRAAWQPNVFGWVATWRALVALELAVVTALGIAADGAWLAVAAAAGWAAASGLAALRQPRSRGPLRIVLAIDLATCMALLALAVGPASFALLALYACSTVVAWASSRPVDAFVAGGVGVASCVAIGLAGGALAGANAEGVLAGAASMFAFFALATAGFFTVAHRIGALEIATEISKERGRYRRDLHDRLGQALCGLHFEVQAVNAVGLDEQAGERMGSLAAGYRDARAMLDDLFSGADEPMVGTNVGAVVRQEARRMSQQTGARIDVEVAGDAARVPPWMRPHVAAIAGESVHNAIKNGEAGGIDVELDVTDELVVLSVTDDGVGFDNPPGTITEREGHYGLREMAERARILGGEVVIASQPGFGTRVRLQAPLPAGAVEDVLERDATRLRRNVWALFAVLRGLLGIVALAQLGVAMATGSAGGPTWFVAALGVVMLVDVLGGIVGATAASQLLQARPRAALVAVVAYAIATTACLAMDVVPWFLLYAPLLLLGVGVHGGRRVAARSAVLFAALVAGGAALVGLVGSLGDDQVQATLVYVSILALLGMCAVQGAKLLDRLEALQIRVRYQALARLRQGLTTRTRDELTRRLDELERETRRLAEATPDDPDEFASTTARLQAESDALKASLRQIVHTLADPRPGRTPAHV